MGFFEGLKNLAKKSLEKMENFNAEVENEQMKMCDFSIEQLKREANRGSFAHKTAARKILKEYGYYQN